MRGGDDPGNGRRPGQVGGAPQVPGLRLLQRLGAGGQGEVWLADDLAAGDRAAVKVGLRGRGPARFEREVDLLRGLDHPHVVRLRRVVELPDGSQALVLEHAAGGSLSGLVRRRGPLTAGEACSVVVPLARTLGELHGRGLVHGDVTPANVLFSADGRVMMADLGSAERLGEAVPERWGSDGYLDPAAEARPSPSEDVYSLGAVLRFALTGSPASQPPASQPPDPRQDALLALADLCTAPEPGRRPDLTSVERITLAAVDPDPVRLDRGGADLPAWLQPVRGVPPPGPGDGDPASSGHPSVAPPSSGDPSGDPSVAARAASGPAGGGAGRRGRGAHLATPSPAALPSSGRPVVVRVAAGVASSGSASPGGSSSGGGTGAVDRRPRSAAEAGWTRSASLDRATRLVEAPTVTLTPSSPVRALRGRGPQGRRDGGSPGDGRRRPQHRRLAGPGPVRRTASWLVAVVAAIAAGWWALGPTEPTKATGAGPNATGAGPRSGGASSAAREGRTPSVTRRPGTPPAGPESVAAAVERLARGRAEAFRLASTDPLAQVDEPGSPALAADRALVARLREAGVRLEGLSFRASGLRPDAGNGGVVLVRATVTTSAHRRAAPGGRTLEEVPASAPQPVTLALVPAPDGVHWLVRQTWSGS